MRFSKIGLLCLAVFLSQIIDAENAEPSSAPSDKDHQILSQFIEETKYIGSSHSLELDKWASDLQLANPSGKKIDPTKINTQSCLLPNKENTTKNLSYFEGLYLEKALNQCYDKVFKRAGEELLKSHPKIFDKEVLDNGELMDSHNTRIQKDFDKCDLYYSKALGQAPDQSIEAFFRNQGKASELPKAYKDLAKTFRNVWNLKIEERQQNKYLKAIAGTKPQANDYLDLLYLASKNVYFSPKMQAELKKEVEQTSKDFVFIDSKKTGLSPETLRKKHIEDSYNHIFAQESQAATPYEQVFNFYNGLNELNDIHETSALLKSKGVEGLTKDGDLDFSKFEFTQENFESNPSLLKAIEYTFLDSKQGQRAVRNLIDLLNLPVKTDSYDYTSTKAFDDPFTPLKIGNMVLIPQARMDEPELPDPNDKHSLIPEVGLPRSNYSLDYNERLTEFNNAAKKIMAHSRYSSLPNTSKEALFSAMGTADLSQFDLKILPPDLQESIHKASIAKVELNEALEMLRVKNSFRVFEIGEYESKLKEINAAIADVERQYVPLQQKAKDASSFAAFFKRYASIQKNRSETMSWSQRAAEAVIPPLAIKNSMFNNSDSTSKEDVALDKAVNDLIQSRDQLNEVFAKHEHILSPTELTIPVNYWDKSFTRIEGCYAQVLNSSIEVPSTVGAIVTLPIGGFVFGTGSKVGLNILTKSPTAFRALGAAGTWKTGLASFGRVLGSDSLTYGAATAKFTTSLAGTLYGVDVVGSAITAATNPAIKVDYERARSGASDAGISNLSYGETFLENIENSARERFGSTERNLMFGGKVAMFQAIGIGANALMTRGLGISEHAASNTLQYFIGGYFVQDQARKTYTGYQDANKLRDEAKNLRKRLDDLNKFGANFVRDSQGNVQTVLQYAKASIPAKREEFAKNIFILEDKAQDMESRGFRNMLSVGGLTAFYGIRSYQQTKPISGKEAFEKLAPEQQNYMRENGVRDPLSPAQAHNILTETSGLNLLKLKYHLNKPKNGKTEGTSNESDNFGGANSGKSQPLEFETAGGPVPGLRIEGPSGNVKVPSGQAGSTSSSSITASAQSKYNQMLDKAAQKIWEKYISPILKEMNKYSELGQPIPPKLSAALEHNIRYLGYLHNQAGGTNMFNSSGANAATAAEYNLIKPGANPQYNYFQEGFINLKVLQKSLSPAPTPESVLAKNVQEGLKKSQATLALPENSPTLANQKLNQMPPEQRAIYEAANERVSKILDSFNASRIVKEKELGADSPAYRYWAETRSAKLMEAIGKEYQALQKAGVSPPTTLGSNANPALKATAATSVSNPKAQQAPSSYREWSQKQTLKEYKEAEIQRSNRVKQEARYRLLESQIRNHNMIQKSSENIGWVAPNRDAAFNSKMAELSKVVKSNGTLDIEQLNFASKLTETELRSLFD